MGAVNGSGKRELVGAGVRGYVNSDPGMVSLGLDRGSRPPRFEHPSTGRRGAQHTPALLRAMRRLGKSLLRQVARVVAGARGLVDNRAATSIPPVGERTGARTESCGHPYLSRDKEHDLRQPKEGKWLRKGTALQSPAKDTLRFPRITWPFMFLFGLIGIATYWAIGYGIYEFALLTSRRLRRS